MKNDNRLPECSGCTHDYENECSVFIDRQKGLKDNKGLCRACTDEPKEG